MTLSDSPTTQTHASLRVAVLVHGGPKSIEAIRARGLTQRLEPDQVLLLYREGSRRETQRLWKQALEAFRPNRLYVLNTAMPGAWLAPAWSRRTGCPYFLDTGDVIYEMARSSGIGAGWRLPLLAWFERHAQRHAATIVVRGSRHQEYLKSTGYPRVVVLRDGYLAPPELPPDSIASLQKELGLENQFIVGMMGSMVYSPKLGICYGWDILEAMAQCLDLPVTAVLIGDGPGQPWLQSRARGLGVESRIRFTGRIPYADVPRYLQLMDVAVSTQTNNLAGRVRTTGKLPEYMANERFILASRVGEAELLLPEPMLLDFEGAVDRAYPRRLAQRVRDLVANPDSLSIRHALSSRVREICSYPVLSEQWTRLIRSVTFS